MYRTGGEAANGGDSADLPAGDGGAGVSPMAVVVSRRPVVGGGVELAEVGLICLEVVPGTNQLPIQPKCKSRHTVTYIQQCHTRQKKKKVRFYNCSS